MMITFACEHCQKPLSVDDALAGREWKCPHCEQSGSVPGVPQPGTDRQPADAATPEVGTGIETTRAQATAVHEGGLDTQPGAGPGAVPREHYDFLAPAQAADELGRLGPYRVLAVIGAEGMGVVFLAEDPLLQRKVAVKAMLPALAARESSRQRFLREPRTVAAIEHDHIVAIFQVGEDRGVPFIVMPLLRGQSLEARLRREPRLPPPEVVRIGKEVAAGLAAAHARGLIHRDIKPANIWLEARGEEDDDPARQQHKEETNRADGPERAARPASPAPRVKLLDFGLARTAVDKANITQTGLIVGTPAYMAPEQANGKAVDARTDLFSLGCVLYRLCTGEAPFRGPDALSTLMAVAHHHPPPLLPPRTTRLGTPMTPAPMRGNRPAPAAAPLGADLA